MASPAEAQFQQEMDVNAWLASREQARKGSGDKPPEPAAAPPPASPGVRGTLPLARGQTKVLAYNELLPSEIAVLARIPGFKPGDPIPADLAEAIAAAQEEEPPQLPDRGIDAPAEIDLSQLPPEKQAEIQQYLEQARATVAAQQDLAKLSPAVAAALNEQSVQNVHLDIEDDRAAEETPPAAPTPVATPDSAVAPMRCPHCDWDMSVPDVPDPGEVDRSLYVQAVLGGLGFSKNYSLLGGALQVCFRELRQDEVDAIHATATHALPTGPGTFASSMEFQENIMRMRLAAQIQRLSIGEKFFAPPGPTLQSWSSATNWQLHAASEAKEYVFTKLLTGESMVHVVLRAHQQFGRLLDKLEAAADRENFWGATS